MQMSNWKKNTIVCLTLACNCLHITSVKHLNNCHKNIFWIEFCHFDSFPFGEVANAECGSWNNVFKFFKSKILHWYVGENMSEIALQFSPL